MTVKGKMLDPLKIDHIILGINNLDLGIAQITYLSGIKPTYGGTHKGGKTHNALLDLGDSVYLEIVAPTFDNSYPGLDELRDLKTIGWAVKTTDMHNLENCLKNNRINVGEAKSGGRKTPEGIVLNWTTLGLEKFELNVLPFFIQWHSGYHPSQYAAKGVRFETLDVHTKKPEKLDKIFNLIQMDAMYKASKQDALVLSLNSPKGLFQI